MQKTKAEIIRVVIGGMTEPCDTSKIFAAVQARISQLPPGDRPSSPLIRNDISKYLWKGKQDHKAPEPSKAPPTQDTFTSGELLAAKKFLGDCGGKRFRATSLLKLISSITDGNGRG